MRVWWCDGNRGTLYARACPCGLSGVPTGSIRLVLPRLQCDFGLILSCLTSGPFLPSLTSSVSLFVPISVLYPVPSNLDPVLAGPGGSQVDRPARFLSRRWVQLYRPQVARFRTARPTAAPAR